MTTLRGAISRLTLITTLLVLVLAACQNPFSIGLGEELNLGVPDIVLDSHPAGEYLSGSISFSGEYTDGFPITGAIDTVTLSFDGGTTTVDATVTPSGDPNAASAWTYTVDTSSLPDGETEVIVTANYSNAGSDPVVKRILYFFDNTAPIVMVTLPQDYGSNAYNGNLTVKGEAADQFGISSVEFRLVDGSNTELAGWREADGTSSWSALFNSLSYIPAGSGVIKVELRATDRAGNVSTFIVHYDDVLARNASQPITAEALVKIARGEAVLGATISSSDLSDIALGEIELNFNQDLDAPSFIVSNPDSLGGAAIPSDNVVSGSPRFTGSVEDDFEGVNPASIQFVITDYVGGTGVAPYDVWTNVTSTSGSGLLVRWTADLVGLTDGTYNLQLRANDNGTASGTSILVPFQVDTGAPTITNVTPLQGVYVNGPFTIAGDANDGTGIASVDVSINEGALIPYTTLSGSAPNQSWTTDIDPTPTGLDLADGNLSIRIIASDGGTDTTYNLQLILDDTMPTATFTNPPASSTVNGSVVIRGTASDNTQVSQVELKIGNVGTGIGDGFEVLTDQTYNWSSTIDVTAFANSTDADETFVGSNVWELDVTARITDAANNVASYVHTFFIDNDLDKPRVTVLAPEDGQAISGSVFLTGTATDDDAVQEVFLQLDVDGDGLFTSAAVSRGPGGELTFNETLPISLNGTTAWSTELNSDGSLYYAGTVIDLPTHTYDGWVTVKIWARDVNGLDGNPVQQLIQFDDTKARTDNLNLATGAAVNGVFLVTGDVVDDNEVTSVEISTDGGQNWTSLNIPTGPGYADTDTITPNWTATLGDPSDPPLRIAPEVFELELSIDTTSSGLDIASNILFLRIRVDDGTDNFVNRTTALLNLNVDNTFPTRENPISSDIDNITGTFTINGTALDGGVIAGVESIHVYMMRGANVYRIDSAAALDTTIGQITADFSDAGGAVATLPYAPANAPPAYYRSEVDQLIADTDGDPFTELISLSGSTYNWYTTFDSTRISDGPIDINYVIFDDAGNGTRYVESGFIKNNSPVITGIEVGTDLDRDGAVEAGIDERFAYTAPFVGRDLIYVDIAATDDNVIPGANWQVFRDNGDPLTDPAMTPTSGDFENGGWFRIDSAAPDHSALDEDTTVDYYAKVTDSVGIETTFPFSVTIDNDDGQDSIVVLDAITNSSVVAGHVESALESSYDGADADVSGTINITGSAEDDQRIQFMYLTIEGYDIGGGAGARTQVAHWDAGSGLLVTDYPGVFVITSQSITTARHEIAYRYEWNTAGGAARAALDIDIAVETEDFGALTTNDIESTVVDIVPYISSVSTDTTGVRDRNIRSAQGYYSIARSDSAADLITINGYNLDPIANGVRVSSERSGLSGTALQGDALTIDTVAGDFTSVTVRKNASGSGWLAVVGGTAGAPIPTINNINSEFLTQNQEPSAQQGNPRLLDDRYLSFFQTVNTGFVNGYYPEMIMNGDFPVFGFVDDSAADDLQFSRGEITADDWATASATTNVVGLIRGLGFQYYGLARDDAGVYHQVSSSTFNSMSQYYIYGEYAPDYNGNCGFGTDNCGATQVYWGGFTGNRADNNGNDALLLDNLAYDPGRLVGRYKNPRVVATGNSVAGGQAATVASAFFDQATGEIIYRNFQVGQAPNGGTTRTFNDTAGTNMTDLEGVTTGDGTRHTVTSSASQYFDMGLTDNGEIVIAYYDEGSGQLNLTFSSTLAGGSIPTAVDGATPATAVNFSAPTAVPNLFIGSYVSMYVETDGVGGTPDPIHIAAHDSSGADLAYIRFDSLTDTSPDVVIVDANLSVGIWTDIAVNASGVPYIGYYNNSETGSRDSVKLAYFLGDAATAVTEGVDGSDEVTGNWEFLTVPASGVPNGGISQFTRVSIGFDSSGDPVVGYLADDIEYTRALPPL